MAGDIEKLMMYIGTLSRDERIKPKHITIFLTLVYIGLLQNSGDQIRITRRVVMETAHIKGIPTYHKYINDLQSFGYIDYQPSYHPAEGSRVTIKL
ncbi:hypothetical protein SIO70_26615 [Chitinophaga sancti]|uniref:hypothetical protein n=1 Tax=Chitinophaga sancti TaxID=1004 RepID=UPI002A75E87C|nr:hypothetical protein [Chitinophaga sancti]WPQ61940.1 hypothetical protein SIO70_26615 [Chitinophaga sancti]